MTVQATARDNDGRGVTASTRDLTVSEGTEQTYTVRLSTQPTGIRNGDTAGRNRGPGSFKSVADETSITFTSSNWETEQTVTVSAAVDADVSDDRASISHTVTGADYGSFNVPGPEILVTATDSGQTTTTGTISVSQDRLREARGSNSIKVTVELDGTRAEDTSVTVLIRAGTASVNDFTARPAAFSLVIPTGMTSAQQTIALRANSDEIAEGDETILVEGSAAGLTFANALVTIEDDDEKSIIVSTENLRVTEQGRDTSYTVKLGSQPTGTVTVTPTLTGDDDVTVEPASLSFPTATWNRAQTVTVRALADPDGDNETATIAHGATGADYEGFVGPPVSVSVNDDDQTSRKVVLSLSPDRVDENAGSPTVTVTAALDGAARASVTEVQVTVTGNTAQAVTDFAEVPPFTVTIPQGQTSGTGTFSFAPVNDSIDEGNETVSVGGTVSGLPVDSASLLLVDDDDRGVTASLLAMTVVEEGDQTYTLVLDTQPAGDVTVTPSVSGNRDVMVTPASLTFTVSNWNTAQTVTVTAAADDDAVDDTALVRHAVSGADYGRVRVEDIRVTVQDNDEQGVTVDPTSVQLREGGRTTYTVVLNTQPTGTVTIRPALAVGSDSDVRVSPSALSFSTSNWKTPKTVTVSAGQDGDSDLDNATVEHAVSGADYGEAAVEAQRVSVTVTDDDVPSTAIVLRLSTDTVREGGGRTQITVTAELDAAPQTDPTALTLDLEGLANGAQEGVDFAAIEPVTLTIATGRTSATARVPVTPVSDSIDEGVGEALQLLAQTTSGLVLRPALFELTIEDDDEKGIVLSRRSLQVREEGRGTYTVKLKSQPTGPVTVALNGEGADAPDLTIEPTQLEFTANDWNATKTVTVSAAEDPDGDDGTASIAHTASGGDYGGVQASLPVTVDDIDQTSRSVQLSLDPDLVEEDAGAVQVTVTAALNGAARSTDTAVEVQATGGTAQAGTDFNDFGTVTVTIPAGLTSATQTFSFSPVDDNLDEGLSETAIFGGTVQGLSVRTATLTIADNDGRGIELSQGPVTLDEEGDTTYQVSLATEPTGTVTVRVTVAGNRDVSASPDSLTFTASNWDQSQTVTVMAARDDDAVPDTAQLRHSATGADYGGVQALPLAVEVRDTSIRGVTVSETALEFREGGRTTYTVVLDTQPTGTVTVTPTVTGDDSIKVSPSSLAFSRSNWKTSKTVTVRADQDLDLTADSALIAHTVSGADYGEEGVTAAQVSVTVTDDDVPSTAIVLRLSTDTVREGGGRKQITVTAELDGAPRDAPTAVVLSLEGLANGAQEVVDFAAINPVTLTIATGRTSATAQVPVTPVNDRIDEDEGEALQLVAETASGLVLRPSFSFELTIEDDDEKGIVLSRRSLQVREEGRGTYTVKLKSQPTGPVTVALNGEGADAPDLTIEPTQLEFTANDWNATKTVTVSAAEDPDGDDGTASIAHTASGGDYGGVQASLPVTVDDIDQTSRSVQLSLDPDLVEEDAGAVQVTVTAALNGAARSTDTAVEVQATGGTAQAGTDFNDFGTVTVTIPTGLTSATQTFSFSPVDDNLDEGLSETAIFGGTVQGLSVRTATLTIADNDGRGIELSQGPVTLDEASDATYQVSLATEPTGAGTVTVRVTVAGNRDVSASPDSLTFTALNWDQPQTVTVMATRDDDAVPDTAQLRHSATGADYGGVKALPLAVEVRDTSIRGVTVSEAALEFREGDRTTYTVVLDTQPTGTVTVTPTVTGDDSIKLSPSSLNFTRSNWRTAKTVTVRADQDLDQTADSASITHTVSGADYGDEGVTASGVSVSVSDDDIPSTEVRLSLSANSVPESAGAQHLTVKAELNASPETADTVVTLTLEAGSAQPDDFVAFGPVTVTIPSGQLRATAQVTVEPVKDAVDEDDETVRISAAFTSRAPDSQLDLNPQSLDVTITDDDERGVTVSEMTLTLLEGGRMTYTVKLNSEPTANVTVTPVVIGGGTRTVTASPGSLTFTKDDWNQAQTVTLDVADDNTVMDEMTVEVEHTVSGGDYESVEVAEVTATLHGLFIDGMTVTFKIPQNGIVTVPEGTPVPASIQLTLPTSLAGQTVSISRPEMLPTDMPRGFRAGNAAVDIELGTTFSGEATICLPSRGRGRVFRWDDEADPPAWVELDAPPAGSPTRLACGVTDRFSLFALSSAEQERVAKAWLARFGRTVAQHVTEAVQERLSAPRAEGLQGTLAGQPLPAPGSALPGVADTRPLLHNPDAEFTGLGEQSGVQSRSLTARDLLTESQFSLTREAADGSTVVVWGRGAVTDFDGRDSQASVDGNVTTGLLGADWASGPLVAGLALSISEGRGSWTLDGEKENVESSMAGLHPFIGYKLTDRLSVWGVAGYGQGELETSSGREKASSDIYMAMVAAGAKGDLLNRADGDSMTLSLKTDGLFVRIGAAASEGGMDKVKADASRLRVALEASHSVPLSNGSELEPSLEIGLRYDGGDAENGFGVDIGAGLGWTNPARGLKAEARARGLLTHEDDGFRELGFSGSFDWQQKPSSDRGAKLSLSQTVGGASSGGADTLFSRNALNDLAVNGNADGGEVLDSHRLEAKFGYGFSAFNDRFTWTPAIGIGRSDNGRDNSLGWRLVRGSAPEDGSLELSFEARRRESANDNSAPQHQVGLQLNARF